MYVEDRGREAAAIELVAWRTATVTIEPLGANYGRTAIGFDIGLEPKIVNPRQESSRRVSPAVIS